MWYIYFLKSSIRNNWIYVGSTNDIQRRLAEHNSGSVRSTKAFAPYKIIYTEIFTNEGEARKREDYFKFWKGRIEKKEILKNCGIV